MVLCSFLDEWRGGCLRRFRSWQVSGTIMGLTLEEINHEDHHEDHGHSQLLQACKYGDS